MEHGEVDIDRIADRIVRSELKIADIVSVAAADSKVVSPFECKFVFTDFCFGVIF
jgi:hypothetical protein